MLNRSNYILQACVLWGTPVIFKYSWNERKRERGRKKGTRTRYREWGDIDRLVDR